MSPARRLVSMLLVLLCIGMLLLDVRAWVVPYARVGLTVSADGTRIVRLRDPVAANAAGVRVGDHIDVRGTTLAQRLRLFVGTVPGGVVHARIAHADGPFRDVTLVANPVATLADTLAGRATLATAMYVLSQFANAILAFGVAAVIAWRRPSVAAAALVYAAGGTVLATQLAGTFAWLPDPLFVVIAFACGTLFAQLPAYALLVFLAWFPHAPATPREWTFARWAAGVFVLACIFESVRTWNWKSYLPAELVAEAASPWLATAAVIVFTATAYAMASGETRRRIAWVLVGVVLSTVGLTVFNAVGLTPATAIGAEARSWWYAAMDVLGMSIWLSLAYAVLRHRVLDLGFVVNRTLVYGVLTSLVVVVVSLVDWLCGHFLASRFSLAFEAVVAVGLGLTLNRLHGSTERLVDRVVFRERHRAETRLRQRATALAFAQSETDIDTTLASDACAILRLGSGAVFRRDPDAAARYRRVAARAWDDDDATVIDAGSILVRSLLTERGIVVLEDLAIEQPGLPAGLARPVIAVPIAFQSELVGFVLYGPHVDGTLPDPEELDLLQQLAKAAGSVYEIVELRSWRRSLLTSSAVALS
ncbi:MAG TPA: hypothetical protein VHT53_00325 [Candidatus Elarobacter sp.]|nr:hypothetical protein [Candidatus Elarobacter sp.]